MRSENLFPRPFYLYSNEKNCCRIMRCLQERIPRIKCDLSALWGSFYNGVLRCCLDVRKRKLQCSRLEELIYKEIKSAVFWGITPRRVVLVYRRFGTTYRSHPHGSRVRVRGTLRRKPEIMIYEDLRNLHSPRMIGGEMKTTYIILVGIHGALMTRSSVFCVIIQCSLAGGSRRFGGRYYLLHPLVWRWLWFLITRQITRCCNAEKRS
jgi:hypothetical protein